MNRTQRAIKRQRRKAENGRSYFKRIFLEIARTDGYSDENSARLKDMQLELKKVRKETRDYMSQQIRTKEVLEI